MRVSAAHAAPLSSASAEADATRTRSTRIDPGEVVVVGDNLRRHRERRSPRGRARGTVGTGRSPDAGRDHRYPYARLSARIIQVLGREKRCQRARAAASAAEEESSSAREIIFPRSTPGRESCREYREREPGVGRSARTDTCDRADRRTVDERRSTHPVRLIGMRHRRTG